MEPGLTWRLGFISFREARPRADPLEQATKRAGAQGEAARQAGAPRRAQARQGDPRAAPRGPGRSRYRRNRPGPAAPSRGRRAAGALGAAGGAGYTLHGADALDALGARSVLKAASVARNSGSAETGAPVACCIQRSGVTRPNDAARSNSAPERGPRSFSSSWNAMRCPIG